MTAKIITLGNLRIGGGAPLARDRRPLWSLKARSRRCVTAAALKEKRTGLALPIFLNLPHDKANRSSLGSFRGPGFGKGLEILAAVKDKIGVPILTDVHEIDQVGAVKGSCRCVARSPPFSVARLILCWRWLNPVESST